MTRPSATWRLRRTAQCAKCPWIVGNDARDIPRGYCEDKHRALAGTIARPGDIQAIGRPLRIMGCHEHDEAHCVGWLHHQLGEGNNLALRLRMLTCDNVDQLRLRGEQHARFEDTLPDVDESVVDAAHPIRLEDPHA